MNGAQRTAPTRAGSSTSRCTMLITVVVWWSCAFFPRPAIAVDWLGIRPGIRAGASLSRLSLTNTPDGIDNQFNPGLIVGATFRYPTLPLLNLELQALYVEQGGQLEGRIEGRFLGQPVTFEGQLRVLTSYIAFPLLASVKAPGAIVRPYVKAGPHIGFRINADAEFEPIDDVVETVAIDDDVNRVDFGFYFSGGLELPLTTFAAYLEVGYHVGLTDLLKEDNDFGPRNAKNHFLAITAGLTY